MYRSSRVFVCAWTALAVSSPAWAVVVFTENFDVDHTANWTFKSTIAGDGPADNLRCEANFFFDYSTVGIPPAPGSGGTTRGLKMEANIPGTAVFSGMSAWPNGLHVTGNFVMTLNVWQNFNGPFPGGGTGSTQITNAGFGGSETSAVPHTISGGTFRSVLFGASADGGTATDYRCYLGNSGFTGTPPVLTVAAGATQPDAQVSPSGVPVYAAASSNNTNAYYSVFGNLAAPAAQLALFPEQSGNTAAGTQGMTWHTWTITKTGNILTWHIDGTLIATCDTTMNPAFTFEGDNVYFGQNDINATSSTDVNARSLLFGLIDNISIDQSGGPPIISDQPDSVVVNVDDNAAFTVVAAPFLGGGLTYQWQQNNANLSDGVLPDGTIVSGSTSATLQLSNIQFGQGGTTYRVIVTESGNPDVATSAQATLYVAAVPCNHPFANADGDAVNDVDLNDFAIVQQCYTGESGAGFDFGHCHCFDRDQDNDIDSADIDAFIACGTRENVPAASTCGDYPSGYVVINEYSYDMFTAAGADATDSREFVELYNPSTTASVDISGWTLRASDTAGPVFGPTGDDNPDYKITGAPGSGTTVLAPGAFYVVGGLAVPNVNQSPGSGSGLWENGPDAIELLDGNGAVIDTVIYERNQAAMAIGEAEGAYWANFVSVDGTQYSLSRWTDGLDSGDNGYDFGVAPETPGTSNHASRAVITAYTPPDVNGGAVADPVPGLLGSFKNARIIDPTVQTNPVAPAGLNPNAIPASPQGGNCIIAWDETGGGNAVISTGLATGDSSFDLWVYLDTSDITVAGAESSSYGIMGSTDPLYNFPDPTGNFFSTTSTGANGNTGLAWVFQKNNAGNHKHLVFVDAKDGGDSFLFGGIYWTVVQDLDLSTTASGWYRLSIAYTSATGAVVARFRDTGGTDLTTGGQPINYAGTPGLTGGFYVGYRESLAGQPLTLRPPTFDGL